MPTIHGLDPAPSGGLAGTELVAIDMADGSATFNTTVAEIAALAEAPPTVDLPTQSGGLQAEYLFAVDDGTGNQFQYTAQDIANFVGAVGGVTNLGTSTNATTVTVTSDTGADATLVAATDSVAGVMSAADKAKLDTLDLPSDLPLQSGGLSGVELVAVDDGTGSMRQVTVQEIANLTPGGGTAGRHAIPITAGAMTPSVVAGCASLNTIASASNQPDIQTIDFDATTQEYAQFSIPMPKSWDEGTVTFKPIWSHASTTTNFGVVWELQAVAVSNDDAIAVSYGTAQSSTDTGGTTNDLYVGPESSAVTIAGTPAVEDVVFFRLTRNTGSGSDTITIDARLHGVILYFTTNAENDA